MHNNQKLHLYQITEEVTKSNRSRYHARLNDLLNRNEINELIRCYDYCILKIMNLADELCIKVQPGGLGELERKYTLPLSVQFAVSGANPARNCARYDFVNLRAKYPCLFDDIWIADIRFNDAFGLFEEYGTLRFAYRQLRYMRAHVEKLNGYKKLREAVMYAPPGSKVNGSSMVVDPYVIDLMAGDCNEKVCKEFGFSTSGFHLMFSTHIQYLPELLETATDNTAGADVVASVKFVAALVECYQASINVLQS